MRFHCSQCIFLNYSEILGRQSITLIVNSDVAKYGSYISNLIFSLISEVGSDNGVW